MTLLAILIAFVSIAEEPVSSTPVDPEIPEGFQELQEIKDNLQQVLELLQNVEPIPVTIEPLPALPQETEEGIVDIGNSYISQ